MDWQRLATGEWVVVESSLWADDDSMQNGAFDATKTLSALGQQGWELVAVVPQSTLFQKNTSTVVPVTSRLSYYFRRPKH